MMLVMLVVPLAFLARYSINRFDPTEMMIAAATPANYLRFFTDPFYWDVLVTTIRVSVIVTVVCLILGLPMAWRLARSKSRWKSLLVVLTVLPLFIGSTIRTAGWMILFARGGMLDIISSGLLGLGHVDLIYTEAAVIAGVLCFILCMNAFATPLLLGGPRFHMMAPLLYWAFATDNNWPFAAAIAFILMGTTLGLTGLANIVIPRRYRAG
jgi:putative spermidine/putrescine transport system permease protein